MAERKQHTIGETSFSQLLGKCQRKPRFQKDVWLFKPLVIEAGLLGKNEFMKEKRDSMDDRPCY